MDDSEKVGAGWDEHSFERLASHYHDFYAPDSREDLEFRLTRRLILVARWWTTLIDEAIKRETGYARTSWQTLFAIAFSGEATTTMWLSQRMGVQWPSLVRTLNQLERDGMIRREDNPDDKRSRLISITAAGVEAVNKVKPVLDRTRHVVLGHVGDDQLRQAIELLGVLPDGREKQL